MFNIVLAAVIRMERRVQYRSNQTSSAIFPQVTQGKSHATIYLLRGDTNIVLQYQCTTIQTIILTEGKLTFSEKYIIAKNIMQLASVLQIIGCFNQATQPARRVPVSKLIIFRGFSRNFFYNFWESNIQSLVDNSETIF